MIASLLLLLRLFLGSISISTTIPRTLTRMSPGAFPSLFVDIVMSLFALIPECDPWWGDGRGALLLLLRVASTAGTGFVAGEVFDDFFEEFHFVLLLLLLNRNKGKGRSGIEVGWVGLNGGGEG